MNLLPRIHFGSRVTEEEEEGSHGGGERVKVGKGRFFFFLVTQAFVRDSVGDTNKITGYRTKERSGKLTRVSIYC
jgi:hypothetical protein